MEGTWNGFYQYHNPLIAKITGHEKTFFKIEMFDVTEEHFKGTVQDDIETGGMVGKGEILGTYNLTDVVFTKNMPNAAVLLPNGTTKMLKQKHKTIYYYGNFSNNNKIIKGIWKLRGGIIWIGIIPLPVFSTSGIFEMNKR